MALGNLYFLLDESERGIKLRRKAIELAPSDFVTVVGLAMRIKDFGQEQEAVDLFEQAMRLSPKHPWYLPFGYGLALHLVGRKEEAAATYQKAIGLSPKTARIHARLAAVSVDLDRMDEARAAADEASKTPGSFSKKSNMRPTANSNLRSSTTRSSPRISACAF